MSEAHKILGWDGRNPPDIETAVTICQTQIDDIAVEIVALSRKPMTNEAQNKLLELLLGFQLSAFSLMNVGYILATGPASDESS